MTNDWEKEFVQFCKDNGIYDSSPLIPFIRAQRLLDIEWMGEEVKRRIQRDPLAVQSTFLKGKNEAFDDVLDLLASRKAEITKEV